MLAGILTAIAIVTHVRQITYMLDLTSTSCSYVRWYANEVRTYVVAEILVTIAAHLDG